MVNPTSMHLEMTLKSVEEKETAFCLHPLNALLFAIDAKEWSATQTVKKIIDKLGKAVPFDQHASTSRSSRSAWSHRLVRPPPSSSSTSRGAKSPTAAVAEYSFGARAEAAREAT